MTWLGSSCHFCGCISSHLWQYNAAFYRWEGFTAFEHCASVLLLAEPRPMFQSSRYFCQRFTHYNLTLSDSMYCGILLCLWRDILDVAGGKGGQYPSHSMVLTGKV